MPNLAAMPTSRLKCSALLAAYGIFAQGSFVQLPFRIVLDSFVVRKVVQVVPYSMKASPALVLTPVCASGSCVAARSGTVLSSMGTYAWESERPPPGAISVFVVASLCDGNRNPDLDAESIQG